MWLDPNLTSPYKFYQYWLNISDEDALKCIRFFSVSSKKQILQYEENHKKAPHLRVLQNELAKEMTCRIHGEESYNKAIEGSKILFGKNTKQSLEKLSEQDFLMIFEGVPTFIIPKNILDNEVSVISLLTEKTNAFNSKGDLRRMLQSNAISLNKEKISINKSVDKRDLIGDRYLLIQKGKKLYDN